MATSPPHSPSACGASTLSDAGVCHCCLFFFSLHDFLASSFVSRVCPPPSSSRLLLSQWRASSWMHTYCDCANFVPTLLLSVVQIFDAPYIRCGSPFLRSRALRGEEPQASQRCPVCSGQVQSFAHPSAFYTPCIHSARHPLHAPPSCLPQCGAQCHIRIAVPRFTAVNPS